MTTQEENYAAVLVQLARINKKISRATNITEHLGKRSEKKLERLKDTREELLNTRALLRENAMT